jgi:PAS domain S-box-containing protein
MFRPLGIATVQWLLLVATLEAQPVEGWHWRSFTSRDGLAESWVGKVTRGPTGRLWISHGTVDGLTVFDGYSMAKVSSPGPRLRVVEGFGGEAWASVWGDRQLEVRGLQRFDGQIWKTAWIAEPRSLPLSCEGQIVALAEGRALVLTPSSVLEVDARSGVARAILEASRRKIGTFLTLRPALAGGIWVTGSGGAGRLDGTRKQWSETALPPDLFNLDFPQEGQPGDLWGVASWRRDATIPQDARAVVRLVGSRFEVVSRSPGVPSLAGGWPGTDGGYWLLRSTRDDARLSHVQDGVEREAPPNKLLSRMVKDVLIDPDGGFWMATGLGLARVAPASWREPPGLPVHEGHFGSILSDTEGRLLVLHETGLLVRRGERWTHHGLPRRNLWMNITQGLVLLGDGRVAVQATAPGLLLYDPRRDAFATVPFDEQRTIIAMAPARDHGVWLVTASAANDYRVDRWDGATFRTMVSSEAARPLGEIRSLLEASDGALWIGGITGQVGRLSGDQLQIFGPAEGYGGGGAFSLLEVAPGRLWLGERTGVREFDGRQFTLVRDGLETVRAMVRSRDGVIWVASGDGLHRFKEGSWLDLGTEDGLPDAACHEVYEDADARLWVGTTNGFRLHHPEADRDPPRTELPNSAPGGEVSPRGEVQLVFGGRDRWDATPIVGLLFSHRLDGATWTPFQKEAGARLRALAPGPHHFEVRSMDRSGNVDPLGAALDFRVLLPWYREPAVLALVGIVVLALGLLGVSLVQRYTTLDRLVGERTSALDAANRELRQSEERLRLVIDAVPELVAWKGRDGRYLGANQAFAVAVGRRHPDEVIGLREQDFLAIGEEADSLAAACREVMESGVPHPRHLDTVHLASGLASLEISRVPLHDHEGRVVGVMVAATDVTSRQQGERERERLELALNQAQRLEAIGMLAGGVAHDFNNVLTVISGHTALLARRVGPEHVAAKDVARIGEAAERASALTRQLLAFSRGQVLQPRVLDINQVVSGLAPMLSRLIGEDVELRTHLDPGLRHVLADPAKLEQVIMNLAGNARDAMPAGGRLVLETANVELEASYPRHHPGMPLGSYVMLAATDTGSGMAPEVLDHVFEPFFTTKPAGQGTGLGLATVYGIVKQSGGDVWVYSEPGKGTTFKIYLPATSQLLEKPPSRADSGMAARATATVLLVEDEPALRELVEETLGEGGYTVIAASRADEALERAAAHPGPIDLLLTDVIMPGISGPVLARRLLDLRPDTRVVFMSGYTANTLGQQGVNEQEVLEKPFTPAALLRKIESVLKDRASDG